MRSVCDVCEAAPAHLFCAADEAALCPKCDEKVCNPLPLLAYINMRNEQTIHRNGFCDDIAHNDTTVS
jgi:hypothetical protein